MKFRGSWSGYEKDNLFHNVDGLHPRFYNVPYLYGLDFDDDGRSAVPVDIDGDGDQDLLLHGLQGLRIMENTLPPRHFARIQLKATKTQSLALGAIVTIRAGGVTQKDYVRVTDGFQSQVPSDLHFGLADAASIESLEIVWPSGDVQKWTNLPADRLLAFVEGNENYQNLELKKWKRPESAKRRPSFSFDFRSKKLGGGEGTLGEFGKPSVINFWSPSCVPCKEELPALAACHAKFASECAFAGVSVEAKDMDANLRMVEAFGVRYPQYIADEALLRNFFGAEGSAILPSTFVFDGSGALRRVFQRPLAAGELESLLESFRGEVPSVIDLENRGERQLQLGNLEEARKWLERALEVDPKRATAYNKLGSVWYGLGNLEKSIAMLQRSIELDPDDGYAHYNLGVGYFKGGKFDEAIRAYQQAIKLLGDRSNFLVALGSAYIEKEQAAEAMDAFDRAVKANPKAVEAFKKKARLHMALNQISDGIVCMERVLALDPSDREAAKWLESMKKSLQK